MWTGSAFGSKARKIRIPRSPSSMLAGGRCGNCRAHKRVAKKPTEKRTILGRLDHPERSTALECPELLDEISYRSIFLQNPVGHFPLRHARYSLRLGATARSNFHMRDPWPSDLWFFPGIVCGLCVP